jgi:predicted RNase H-like HicB family nuclease
MEKAIRSAPRTAVFTVLVSYSPCNGKDGAGGYYWCGHVVDVDGVCGAGDTFEEAVESTRRGLEMHLEGQPIPETALYRAADVTIGVR